jgi:hypothetical protein
MALHAIKLNTELARPIGIVDGTRPGGSNRRPRCTTLALTDCIVTYADGTTRTIAATRNPRSTRSTAPQKRSTPIVRDYTNRHDTDVSLMARMGSIHQ